MGTFSSRVGFRRKYSSKRYLNETQFCKVIFFRLTRGQAVARVLIVMEPTQRPDLLNRITDSFKSLEPTINIGVEFVFIDHEDLDSSMNQTCGVLSQQQYTAVLDLSWGGWSGLRTMAQSVGLPYLRQSTG